VENGRTRRGDLVPAVEDITSIPPRTVRHAGWAERLRKSTLLKAVAGLTSVSGGTVRVRDTVVREPFPDVGIVFSIRCSCQAHRVDNVLFSADMLVWAQTPIAGARAAR
jgi:hypothetical protein